MASELTELSSQARALAQSILSSSLHGKKICLIGSAEYGPTNEPIRIKSTVGLYNKFGKTGTLIDAFHAVKYTTKNNEVYLVKTTGEHATTYLNVNIVDGEIISNAFVLMASESNELYNDIKIEIDTDSITIVYPDDVNVPENRIKYDFNQYPTIELLSNAINKDTKNKRSYILSNYMVDPSTRTKDAFYVCNPDVVSLYGGQCGLGYSKNLLYSCLERTYDILESLPVDIVIPVDAFLDDIYPDDSENQEYQYNMKYYQSTKDYLTSNTLGETRSFMDQLINFCYNQLNFGIVTTGILGFNSVHDWTTNYLFESDYIVEMYKHCLEYNRAMCQNKDYSFLVSVVAGDIEYNHGTIIDNGYLAYGAFNASMQINVSNTNTKISDNISLYNEFSEEVLADLAENGITTFRHSPLYNTVVVYDGVTAVSRKESPLNIYCNVRMVQMCISYLNILFQFFIGYDLKMMIESKVIQQNMDNILNVIESKGIITNYHYTLEPDYINGTLTVNLDLLTNYMTESVKISSVINVNAEE